MNALMTQHERWLSAQEKLGAGPPPKRIMVAVPSAPVPVPPDPVATIHKPPIKFPTISAMVEASFPLSARIDPEFVPPKGMPPWKAIAIQVARKHKLTLADLISPRRDHASVIARHEVMWRCRNETTMSLPQIGRRLGRDHTSVLHGIKKHQQRMEDARL